MQRAKTSKPQYEDAGDGAEGRDLNWASGARA
jgi:hypothetical protein